MGGRAASGVLSRTGSELGFLCGGESREIAPRQAVVAESRVVAVQGTGFSRAQRGSMALASASLHPTRVSLWAVGTLSYPGLQLQLRHLSEPALPTL